MDKKFTVRIDKMVESSRETFWVTLTNLELYDARELFSQPALITPYYSEQLNRAEFEAKKWADFLGIEVEPHNYKGKRE